MTHTILYEKMKAISGTHICSVKELQKDYSNEDVKQYKLMLKQHWETGMNYLCITKRKNFVKYTGSGKFWKSLIKARPSVILTTLLFTSDNVEEFDEECLKYSLLFDVVNNPDFCNLIPELGYQGNQNNFQVYFETASEETLKDLYKRRAETLKLNHPFRKENNEEQCNEIRNLISTANRERCDEIRNKISITNSNNWKIELQNFLHLDPNNTPNMFYEIKMSHIWEAAANKRKNMTPEELLENSLNRSIASKKVWNERTEEEIKEFGNKISIGRLNMTPEAKLIRGKRVSESFKNSEKRISFNESMKVNRIGAGNPMAKIIHWYGKIFYTRQEFNKFIKAEGLSRNYCDKILKDNSIIECYIENPFVKEYIKLICPFCNKEGNNSSSFKRFHFKNCKHNPDKGN